MGVATVVWSIESFPGSSGVSSRQAYDERVVHEAPDALALFATAGPNFLLSTSMSGLPRVELEYQQ